MGKCLKCFWICDAMRCVERDKREEKGGERAEDEQETRRKHVRENEIKREEEQIDHVQIEFLPMPMPGTCTNWPFGRTKHTTTNH